MHKEKKKIWIIIPARSGSKSIKNKNLQKIGNKSLVEIAINFAKEINHVEKIVFSSNSTRYLDIADKIGVDILHHRSNSASKDSSTDLDFFRNFIKDYSIKDLPEFFIHLRPTTPLREKKILNNALSFFLKHQKRYTSMRSVSKMSESSFKTFVIKNSKLCSLNNNFELDTFNNPKNNFPETYFPNGYIDIVKTKNIFRNFIHGNKVLPYIINHRVVDIDSIEDLKYANYIFKSKKL